MPAAGLGLEDTQMIIESMAQAGAEPTFCMGDDTPLPVLSAKPHMLSDYFKQRFAQARAPVQDLGCRPPESHALLQAAQALRLHQAGLRIGSILLRV